MGKPTAGNAAVPCAESIGSQEQTEGSETSQYLEEKKANAIPSVVASESGTGQTAGGNSVGVVGPHLGPVLCRRAVWKGGPQRVKAPKSKRRAGRAVIPSKAGHVQSCLNLRG